MEQKMESKVLSQAPSLRLETTTSARTEALTTASGSLGDRGWTDERVELLKRLWADGLSASQIATKLRDVSRNAVIGKIHRLGLAGRATTSRIRTTRPRSSIALFPKRSPQAQCRTFGSAATKVAPLPLPAAQEIAPKFQLTAAAPVHLLRVVPDHEATPDSRLKLLDLKDNMCHWPIGDPKEKNFHFCGRRRSFDAPYCEHHAAIAYNPAARKRKA
jgi:GcrA cell cycle regulator